MLITEKKLRRIIHRVILSEIGMSNAALGSSDVFEKKPSDAQLCDFMKRLMSYIHTTRFIMPRLKKVAATINADDGLKATWKKIVKHNELSPSEGTKLLWRMQLPKLTNDMAAVIIRYAVAGRADERMPDSLKSYIDQEFLDALRSEFFEFLKEWGIKQAAIQVAGAATATSTMGLSLTVNAGSAIYNLFKGISCLEDLNNYADQLVGVKHPVRMDTLVPDYEKSREGLEEFAKAVFS